MTTKKHPLKGVSKEELFFRKLKTDREWYIETFLKIKNKASEIIDFKLNEAQKIVMGKIKYRDKKKKFHRYIILKARQMGLSTLFEGLIFHDTSTKENINSLIIAHEEQASSNLFQMSKLFYENLPLEIRPMKKYSNGRVLQFENPTNDDGEKHKNPGLRSKITIATAGSGEVARSATFHNVHASEVAFFPDPKTTMLGLLQSVPDTPNSMVVIESTANGVGNWFHETWQRAVRGENDFVPIFLPWFTDSTYTRKFDTYFEKDKFVKQVNAKSKSIDGEIMRTYEYELMKKFDLTYEQLYWRHWTIQNKCEGDEELFMQEYPATPEEAFISSGRPRFNIKSLRKYQARTKKPQMVGYLQRKGKELHFVEDSKGYLSIWQKPEENTFYSIGADVAEGLVHGDYSCGLVGRNDSLDIVAMWHGHIDPDLFGDELIKLAEWYNGAYLGVENNNHGLTTLNRIKHQEYWNIYHSKIFDKFSDDVTTKMGWSTTIRTKPLMIDKLAEYVREGYLGIPSDAIIGEMFTYVIEDNGKTNAQPGCHDDTVMAAGILLQLMLENMGEDFTPEIPFDATNRRSPKEIIDPLFESDEEGVEVSE